VEVLAAGLTGAQFSHQASSLGDDMGGPPRLGQTLIAFRPGDSSFVQRIDGLLADMAAEPGVRIPGERRHANRRRIEAEGVSIDEALESQLRSLGGRV
jgi:(2R)-3-sulfolactate dehydrogenase (NADP+)